MKIGLLAATPPPIGGIATWTLRMLKINEKHNCEYVLIDEKMDRNRNMFGDRRTRKRNIVKEIQRCNRIWGDLNKSLIDESLDLIHANIPSTVTSMLRECVSCIITHLHRRKFVIEFHCTIPNTRGGAVWNLLLRFLITRSDGIFVLNQQSYDFLKDRTQSPIFIIPNFVENTEINDHHEISNSIKKIVYVGGVIKSKGVLDIIEVAKHYKTAEFILVGNADTEVTEYARNVENVVLTGSCDHEKVMEILNSADLFIFLSYFSGEGFSVALLEAMAAGLPCIVTDWAANKDMIGETGGVVVPVKSPEKVVEALHRLESQEKRYEYSKRNIDIVKKYYSDDVVFSRVIEGYRSVIDRS